MKEPSPKKIITTIRDVINEREPFGPFEAKRINDISVMKELFDQNNKLFEQFKKKPSIIEGRRGSGKTTFLNMADGNDKSAIKIIIQDMEIMELLLQEINKLATKTILVESVANIWKIIFYIIIGQNVFHLLPKEKIGENKIRNYLGAFHIDENLSLVETIKNVLSVMNERSIDDIGLLMEFEGINFKEYESSLVYFLSRNKKHVLILIDLFDEYKRLFETVSRSFQGLLKCLGEFNTQNEQCGLIMCIPTEIHYAVDELSSNPTKDFAFELSLTWHAKELLSIVANRFKKYCELYRPELYNRMINLNTNNKKDARNILLMVLPESVENIMGMKEDSIGYIMRHTLLQPRQLIQLMNKIANSNGDAFLKSPYMIDPNSVRDALHKWEGYIIEEIFSAFKIVYPNAREICDFLYSQYSHIVYYGRITAKFC